MPTPEEVASLWNGPNGSHNPLRWDEQGRPYYDSSRGRQYVAPMEAISMRDDPRAVAWAKSQGASESGAASRGGFGGNSTWNSDTGTYEHDNFFDSPAGALVLGGSMMAAPWAIEALSGGGGSATAGGVQIPGAEFDPGMVYGGAGGPTAGIPPAFGQSATDSIYSGAGAPGTPDWLKVATDVGKGLTNYETGAAQGRNLDNLANIGYANAQNNLYNNQLLAPQTIASNAVRGDILSNAQDVSIALPPGSKVPVPTISGGLRPSMFSPTTRALGTSITNAAANTPIPMPSPPVLQPMETAGTGTDIVNGVNTGLNFLPAAYNVWKAFNA